MPLRSLARFMLLVPILACGMAQAQLFRAYLASDGLDANPCTLQQPCRLLPAALAAVASGGEIWMLDSANFNSGTVTIGKSVSILAIPGAVGSIVTLNGGPAIDIAASGLDVSLRNVVIARVAGAPAGTDGVRMTGASRLAFEESQVVGVPGHGIYVSGPGKVTVHGSTFRGCGGSGIYLDTSASATIATSRFVDNGSVGVHLFTTTAGTTVLASVTDSVISGGAEGVNAFSQSQGVARASILRTTIERTEYGIVSHGSSLSEVSIGSSMLVNVSNPWYQAGGGVILSRMDNLFRGNGVATGTKTPLGGE